MNKRVISGTIFIAAAFVLLFSCSKNSSTSGPTPPEPGKFDKTAMLTHYADNIIIPAYQHMQEDINAMKIAVDAFADGPSAETRAAAKEAYIHAHLQYANIEVFNFGPAGTSLLDYSINFSGGIDNSFGQTGDLAGFSIDSVTIENNISSGSYDLSSYSRNTFYSQGFPALNYLIFAPDAIEKFGINTASRVKYVKDVTQRMKLLVDEVVAQWSTYRSTFIANTKTDVGSPIGNLVNQFALQIDIMKGPRIGWPFGKQSNGIVFGTKSEAYFAGVGAQLAVANMTNLKNAYTGGSGSKGIAGYLVSLNKGTLNTDVNAQFDAVIAKLNDIPDPLAESFISSADKVEAAYKEIQKLLTLLKTDVASATGVQITFMDNDGD